MVTVRSGALELRPVCATSSNLPSEYGEISDLVAQQDEVMRQLDAQGYFEGSGQPGTDLEELMERSTVLRESI